MARRVGCACRAMLHVYTAPSIHAPIPVRPNPHPFLPFNPHPRFFARPKNFFKQKAYTNISISHSSLIMYTDLEIHSILYPLTNMSLFVCSTMDCIRLTVDSARVFTTRGRVKGFLASNYSRFLPPGRTGYLANGHMSRHMLIGGINALPYSSHMPTMYI